MLSVALPVLAAFLSPPLTVLGYQVLGKFMLSLVNINIKESHFYHPVCFIPCHELQGIGIKWGVSLIGIFACSGNSIMFLFEGGRDGGGGQENLGSRHLGVWQCELTPTSLPGPSRCLSPSATTKLGSRVFLVLWLLPLLSASSLIVCTSRGLAPLPSHTREVIRVDPT